MIKKRVKNLWAYYISIWAAVLLTTGFGITYIQNQVFSPDQLSTQANYLASQLNTVELIESTLHDLLASNSLSSQALVLDNISVYSERLSVQNDSIQELLSTYTSSSISVDTFAQYAAALDGAFKSMGQLDMKDPTYEISKRIASAEAEKWLEKYRKLVLTHLVNINEIASSSNHMLQRTAIGIALILTLIFALQAGLFIRPLIDMRVNGPNERLKLQNRVYDLRSTNFRIQEDYDQLVRENTELKRKTQTLSAEVFSKNKQLKASSEEMKDLSVVLNNSLRSPVRAIQRYLRMLKQDDKNVFSEQSAPVFKEIQRRSLNVQDTLEYLSAMPGDIEQEVFRINMKALLAEIRLDYVDNPGLSIQLPKKAPPFSTSPEALKVILRKVLTFIDAVRNEEEQVQIQFDIRLANDFAKIELKCIGLSHLSEYQEQSLFSIAREYLHEREEDHLSLAIAQKLAESYGATISYEALEPTVVQFGLQWPVERPL